MIESPSIDTAAGILERRGITFTRRGNAYLARCPLHADSKPSLRLWQGKDGQPVITCFPCGINDRLPRFICRLDGKEPQGKAWASAMEECGHAREKSAIPRKHQWSEWEMDHHAEIPIALAFNNPATAESELAKLIEAEVAKGHDPQSPYTRRLIEAMRLARKERRIA